MRWLPWIQQTQSARDSALYIASLNGLYRNGLGLAVRLHGELIGTVSFHRGDARHHRMEIGYWIAPPYQRLGHGLRTVRAALKELFANTDVHRVEARVQVENRASLMLLDRLGFQPEGLERQGIRCGQRYLDHRILALLRPEFEGLVCS